MKKNTKKGFTLVELLVVIAILAILSSVAVVGYTAFVKKADDQAAATEVESIATIIEPATYTQDVVIKLSNAKFVVLHRDNNTITATEATSAPTDSLDVTNDIGADLVKKLSYDAGLVYTYKDAATAKKLYAAPAADDGE